MQTHITLTSTEAHLYVTDVGASCRFYVAKLGFAIAFTYGNPPYVAQLCRDHARLNVRLVRESVFVADVRAREALLSASLTLGVVGEIERLFASYRGAGVPFHQELKTEPWGATTFIVEDPDGNLVLFAGPEARSAAHADGIAANG